MFQGSYKEGFNILLLYTLLQRILFLFISGRSEFFNNLIEIGLSMLYIKGNFQCVSRMFEGPLNTLRMFQDFMSYCEV